MVMVADVLMASVAVIFNVKEYQKMFVEVDHQVSHVTVVLRKTVGGGDWYFDGLSGGQVM